MKKTISINISGIVFNIDEDAYERLQKYLSEINSRFISSDEGKEIISDVEARIAEIFSQKINESKQVVTIEDVESVISIMGDPKEFGGEDQNEQNTKTENKNEKQETISGRKRLHRDPDSRVIGGVCSGLGAYFNIDPVFLRIFMIITFFAFGPLLYIILWIAIPKARTTAQKLEMKGEQVNLNNISKSVKEEFEDIKNTYKDKNTNSNSDSLSGKFIHAFTVILTGLVKFFVIGFGIFLVVVGLLILFGFFGSAFFGIGDITINNTSLSITQASQLFLETSDLTMLWVMLLTFISIPVIAIIYAGIKMIFKIKHSNKLINIILLIFWLISLIYIIVFGVSEARNYSAENHSEQKTVISDTAVADTLIVKMTSGKYAESEETDCHFDHIKCVEENKKIKLYGNPQVSFVKNDSNKFAIIIKKIARGDNRKNARENASKIIYESPVLNNIKLKELTLASEFYVKENEKWRNQEISIIISVPVGKTVYMDKSLQNYLYDVENVTDTNDEDMAGKYWTMKKEGLYLTGTK